jgi:hypothetical protein
MKTSLAHHFASAIFALAATNAVADEAKLLDEARMVASSVPPKLAVVLQDAIAQNGLERAIDVCSERAPQLAREASEKTGWNIRRVSLRNRNPRAVPDAWERAVLLDFDQRAAAGENPATLESGQIVSENGAKVYRYMKALPVQGLCLSCHGAPEKISPAVKARLNERYPKDSATGYSLGQVRGAMTIKRPL